MAIPTKQSAIYSNWVMTAPDGTFLCRCGNDRVEWYLRRGLADDVSVENNEPTIRLKFQPKGSGHNGNLYYMSKKANQCAVCGETEGMTRHHVVPYAYRRHFPLEIKSRSSHDVLPLCVPCHEAYEREAFHLNTQIAAEHGITIHSGSQHPKHQQHRDLKKIGSAVVALMKHTSLMPADRVEKLQAIVREYFGEFKDSELPDLLDELDEERGGSLKGKNEYSYGAIVAKKLDETNGHQAFVVRWRQHFVDTMKPKYMPTGWDINHVHHQ